MGVNKKKLQLQLSTDTGKSVIMKDISNIALAAKRERHGTKNNLSKCVDMLRITYNCTVDISTDDDDNFCGLFIQDREMQETFGAFPEIIFLDATYKLLDLQFPVYLFVAEDSNEPTSQVIELLDDLEITYKYLLSKRPQEQIKSFVNCSLVMLFGRS